MVSVTIKIEGRATTDIYPRKLGLAIDQTLNTDFDTTQPHKVVKTEAGTDLIIYPAGFIYETTRDLDYGKHTLRCAPTSAVGYEWQFEVFIDGVSKGVQTGITKYRQYSVTFEIEKPPPTLAETISGMMGTMVGLMMLVMVITMMTGIMKAVKRRG